MGASQGSQGNGSYAGAVDHVAREKASAAMAATRTVERVLEERKTADEAWRSGAKGSLDRLERLTEGALREVKEQVSVVADAMGDRMTELKDELLKLRKEDREQDGKDRAADKKEMLELINGISDKVDTIYQWRFATAVGIVLMLLAAVVELLRIVLKF